MILCLLSYRFVYGVKAVFEIIHVFGNRQKLIELFLEIKNKNLWCLLYRNVAEDLLFQKHFTNLDYLDRFSR